MVGISKLKFQFLDYLNCNFRVLRDYNIKICFNITLHMETNYLDKHAIVRVNIIYKIICILNSCRLHILGIHNHNLKKYIHKIMLTPLQCWFRDILYICRNLKFSCLFTPYSRCKINRSIRCTIFQVNLRRR